MNPNKSDCANLNRKILGVGHPRTGTGYTSQILRNWGMNVGHEKLLDDGMVAWQMLLCHKKYPVLPWIKDNPKCKHLKIDYSKLSFDHIIYNIRNPKNSIPSIYFTDKPAAPYRNSLIEESTNRMTNLEKVILSIIYFDKKINSLYPNHIWYRVENQSKKIYDYLSVHYDLLSFEKNQAPKNVNSRDNWIKRYNVPTYKLDYTKVSKEIMSRLLDFCKKYQYDTTGF